MEMIIIPVIFLSGFPFNYLLKINGFDYSFILTNVIAGLTLLMSWISGSIYFKENIDVLREEKK